MKKLENAPLVHKPITKIGGYVCMNLIIKMLGLDQILEATFKLTKTKRILGYVIYSIENKIRQRISWKLVTYFWEFRYK